MLFLVVIYKIVNLIIILTLKACHLCTYSRVSETFLSKESFWLQKVLTEHYTKTKSHRSMKRQNKICKKMEGNYNLSFCSIHRFIEKCFHSSLCKSSDHCDLCFQCLILMVRRSIQHSKFSFLSLCWKFNFT